MHEVLQAFVFDDDMPQRRHIPAPAVRPVTPADQDPEPVQVLAFLLPLKARQEHPPDPACPAALDLRQRLVEFKRMDIIVGADRYQAPFVQVGDDVMPTVRQGRQGFVIVIIRFQIAQVVRRGMARKRHQEHGVLQCEVLWRRTVMLARIGGFDNLPFHFIRLKTRRVGLCLAGFARAPVSMPVPAHGTTGRVGVAGGGRSRRPLADQVRVRAVGTEQVFMNDRRKQMDQAGRFGVDVERLNQ